MNCNADCGPFISARLYQCFYSWVIWNPHSLTPKSDAKLSQERQGYHNGRQSLEWELQHACTGVKVSHPPPLCLLPYFTQAWYLDYLLLFPTCFPCSHSISRSDVWSGRFLWRQVALSVQHSLADIFPILTQQVRIDCFSFYFEIPVKRASFCMTCTRWNVKCKRIAAMAWILPRLH